MMLFWTRLEVMSDDASMPDEELASFQVWRRAAKAMWVSELLRADGRAFRTRFDRDLQRRAKTKKRRLGLLRGANFFFC